MFCEITPSLFKSLYVSSVYPFEFFYKKKKQCPSKYEMLSSNPSTAKRERPVFFFCTNIKRC
jgi:hypothetical protein